MFSANMRTSWPYITAKFDLIYGNDELQEKLAELVPKRINLKNVFDCGKV